MMPDTLRQSMESALAEMATNVAPNLRPGVIPKGTPNEALCLEETLDLPIGTDLMIEIERRGFRAIFLKNLTDIVYQRLESICIEHPAGILRRQSLQKELTGCLEGSFELFWGALEALVRRPLHLPPGDPLDYLAITEDLIIAFIRTYQDNLGLAGLTQKIAEKCANHERAPITNFRGASIPSAMPLFREFGELCEEANESHSEKVFGRLMQALDDLTEEATRGKQEAFFIPGALKGWLPAYNALLRAFPNLRVYGSPHEYLSMLRDREHCRIVEGRTDFRDGDDLDLQISRKILESIFSDASLVDQPVVFLSSVRRTGERVDVNCIMQEIRRKAPNVIFVVDAAQDHYMYPSADIVLYSKRFGGTGTGLIMLKKDTIPSTVRQEMATQGGITTHLLAATIAGLRCERSPFLHIGNRLEDLLTTFQLWGYRGGGTYIDRQAARLASTVAEHPVLNEHFTACYSGEEANAENPQLWKSSRIITLYQKPASTIKLKELVTLADDMGIHLDWISPQSEPECQSLISMAERPYSLENCQELCREILEFQTETRPHYFTEMIALPEVFNGTAPMSYETYEKQKAYLRDSLARQNMIRIYINIQMNNEDLDRLISALISAVSALTTSD